jgi:hypothetical protein
LFKSRKVISESEAVKIKEMEEDVLRVKNEGANGILAMWQ